MRFLAIGVSICAAAAGCGSSHDRPGDGGAADARPDVDGGGRDGGGGGRLVGAFEVDARLTGTGTMGTLPPEHAFVLQILEDEAGRPVMIAGAFGTAAGVALDEGAGGYAIREPIDVGIAHDGTCGGPGPVTYRAMTLVLSDDDGDGAADSLTGTASGEVHQFGGDVIWEDPFMATLTGTVDRRGPTLQITGERDARNPLDGVYVRLMEPVPADRGAVLTGGLEPIPFDPLPDGDVAIGAFVNSTGTVLDWGAMLTLSILPVFVDLAGNGAEEIVPPYVQTAPDPGLSPEDGFEGAPHVLLAGNTRVIESSAVPLAGAGRTLYVGPSGSGGGAGRATLRLAVSSGDTTLRFTLRRLMLVDGAAYFLGRIRVAPAAGGLPTDASLPSFTGTSTPITYESFTALGSAESIEIPLPAGAVPEVLLDVDARVGCGGPLPPEVGLLIDDVRVE